MSLRLSESVVSGIVKERPSFMKFCFVKDLFEIRE